MHRNVLVVGGLVVAAAVIALVVYARRAGEGPAPAPKATTSSPPPIVPKSSPSAPTVAPTLPGSAEAPAAGSALEYEIGGMKVRDHRGGDQQPMQLPPNVHPPEARELPSTLTHDIAQKVKQVMMTCAADLPRDARGTAPRLQGQILVAIKNGTLTITKATMLFTDVVGDAAEPIKSCIEQKSVGLQTAAADQADMDSYSINLTFAVP